MRVASNLVKSMIPVSVKRAIKSSIRSHKLAASVRELRECSGVPSRESVNHLRVAWGNAGFSADADFLIESVRLARSCNGNILECGSGVSTFLFAVLGISVYSLEDDLEWLRICNESLERFSLSCDLIHAPLISFGDYWWYDIPAGLPLMSLILCDGPRGTTPGGRIGLMPAFHHHVTPDCVILMDDVERPAEQAIIQQWATEFDFETRIMAARDGKLAFLTMRN